MDGTIELAKILKERDNPSQIGIGVGVVKSKNPLKIAFSSLLLDSDMVTSTIATHEVGDNLIIAPDALMQHFFVLGKVV